MVQLKYFASIREQLQLDQEQLALNAGDTVADLLKRLQARGSIWAQVLGHPQLLCALNQEVVDPAAPVTAGDELALFPPVTGG